MSRRFIILIIGHVLVVVFIYAYVLADSWYSPKPKNYYSSNEKYYLEVITGKLANSSIYFQDLVNSREDTDSSKEVNNDYCKGTLYELGDDKKYHEKWIINLANVISPVRAIVSDSGNYVITFDEWHSVGYGNNVVVIYGLNGKLIKKFALEDIIPKEKITITKIPHTASSRWWGGIHYLDEEHGILILKVVSNGKMPGDKDVEFQEVKINLKTGEKK